MDDLQARTSVEVIVKPIATALRRLADWMDPTGYAHWKAKHDAAHRGIPAADRGDDLDWDIPHGEDYR